MDESVVSPALQKLFLEHGWERPSDEVVAHHLDGLIERGYWVNEQSRRIIGELAGFSFTVLQEISFDEDYSFWRPSSAFDQDVYQFFGHPMSPVASVFHNNGYLWCDDVAFFVTFWPGWILWAGEDFSSAIDNIIYRNELMIEIGEVPDDDDEEDA